MSRAARILIAVGAACIGLVLSGCGANGGAAPNPTASYLAFIHEEASQSMSSAKDETLIKLGTEICLSLDAGVPMENLINTVGESFDLQSTMALMRGSVANLCPQHLAASASPTG